MWDDHTVAFSIRAPWFHRNHHFRSGRYHPSLVTVWHVDPKGDRGWACGKPDPRRLWRFHVHHWKIQVHPWQDFKQWAFERCAHCKRAYPWGYAPVSHGKGSVHHECSTAIHLRDRLARVETLARAAMDGYCRKTGLGTRAALDTILKNDTQDISAWHTHYTAREVLGVLDDPAEEA